MQLTERNGGAQVLYLTSDEGSISLSRQHTIAQASGKPLEFSASADVPYVPPNSTPLQRWKHYVARAFAARHILRLTLSAGTADEGPAIKVCTDTTVVLLPAILQYTRSWCVERRILKTRAVILFIRRIHGTRCR
jgi:hypothetical protein